MKHLLSFNENKDTAIKQLCDQYMDMDVVYYIFDKLFDYYDSGYGALISVSYVDINGTVRTISNLSHKTNSMNITISSMHEKAVKQAFKSGGILYQLFLFTDNNVILDLSDTKHQEIKSELVRKLSKRFDIVETGTNGIVQINDNSLLLKLK